MGGKIWFIVMVIIALGLGLYLYSSGAFVNGLKSFNSLISASSTFSFFDLNSSTVAHGPSAPIGPPPPDQHAIAPSSVAPTINPADIPAGYTLAQISPYFHEVLFGTVSAGTIYYYGTITLNTYLNANATGTIDVTGWHIKSTDGDEYVPKAVNLYDPTGLAPASDINVKNGDTVYLYSSSAPFNLRLNECIGYAAHVANFIPALPQSCPYVDRSQIRSFSSACQNYLLSINGCQTPNMFSSQVPNSDSACMNYLENNFNYRSCFGAHNTDANFLSNQIWVWTGSNIIDPYNGTILLLDKNGLLVDESTY